MGKVIHWESCKKFKFVHTTKWYMDYPEPVQENETLKIPWDSEIQTAYLISARPSDSQQMPESRFWRSGWSLGKTGGKQRER